MQQSEVDAIETAQFLNLLKSSNILERVAKLESNQLPKSAEAKEATPVASEVTIEPTKPTEPAPSADLPSQDEVTGGNTPPAGPEVSAQ